MQDAGEKKAGEVFKKALESNFRMIFFPENLAFLSLKRIIIMTKTGILIKAVLFLSDWMKNNNLY